MVALLAAIAAGVLFSPGAGAAPGDLDPAFSGDGRQQTDFELGIAWASAMAVQPDGKIVAVGTTSGGRRENFALARYGPDGSLDASFSEDGRQVTHFATGPAQSAQAGAVAIQPDGKLVVVGAADHPSGSAFALARYNPDGSLDPTFSDDGRQTTGFGECCDGANGVAIQADGKIVAVGNATGYLHDPVALARYNADGSLDTTFSGDGRQTSDIGIRASAVAIQADGSIVVAGATGFPGYDFALARYGPDGSLDPTFSADGVQTTDFGDAFSAANSVVLQADGRIVAAGSGEGGFALARYDPDGSLDPAFSGDGRQTTDFGDYSAAASGVALQADSKIVAVGSDHRASGEGGEFDFAVARYDTDGSLDPTFSGDGRQTTDISGFDGARGVAVQPDGKIVAVGGAQGHREFALARYNADGSLDPAFSGDGVLTNGFGSSDAANGVAIQADGKIVAVGGVGQGASSWQGDFALARYNPNGSLDPTFSGDGRQTTDLGDRGGARAVAIQSDGKIVVVGGANGDFGLARYNPDSSLDTSFSDDGMQTTDFGGFKNRAQAVAIQPDGQIVAVGGVGEGASGWQGDFAVARYNPDGSLDETFSGDGKQTTDLGKFDRATAVALQPDGRIVAAGGAAADFALVRYESDGSLDSTFSGDGVQMTDFGARDRATGVAVQSDGGIVAVGYGDLGNFALARYGPGGSLDPTFSGDGVQTTDFGGHDYAGAVALQPDGKIVAAGGGAGGDLTLARYDIDGSLDPTFSGDGVQTTDFGGPDAGHGVALEAGGDVVVVGRGIGTDETFDFVLARYLGS